MNFRAIASGGSIFVDANVFVYSFADRVPGISRFAPLSFLAHLRSMVLTMLKLARSFDVAPLVKFVGALIIGCSGLSKLAAAAPKAEPDADLERLVGGLASHNEPPKLVKMPHESLVPIYPKAFDWSDEARIQKTIRELWKRDGDELWPHLVRHVDDQRYSFTHSADDEPEHYAFNRSVGWLCRMIAHDDLTYPYMQFVPTDYPIWDFHVPPYKDMSNPEPLKDLKAWYKARNGKPLYELQIEMCKWAIKRMQSFPQATKKEKADFASRVEEQIEKLTKAKRAIVTGNEPVHEEYDTFTAERAKEIREQYESGKRK